MPLDDRDVALGDPGKGCPDPGVAALALVGGNDDESDVEYLKE